MESATCPHCNGEIELTPGDVDTQPDELHAEIIEWNEAEVYDPYPGQDTDRHIEQHVRAKIDINDHVQSFDFYYAPEYDVFTYVVRSKTSEGQKSKDVYTDEDGIYVKNRGVPWDEDKQWTYLSREQCEERARIAGIGPVKPNTESRHQNRFKVYIDEIERPLIDDNGLAEDLVEALAKAHMVFQSRFD